MNNDRRVLVVDDEEDVVETIKNILHKEGCKVEKAYGGKECLEKLGKSTYKAVFLDIMMPKIDGYKVAEEIKKKHKDKIKIVYVTIKPRLEVEMKHADYIVQKPFEISDIVRAVNFIFHPDK